MSSLDLTTLAAIRLKCQRPSRTSDHSGIFVIPLKRRKIPERPLFAALVQSHFTGFEFSAGLPRSCASFRIFRIILRVTRWPMIMHSASSQVPPTGAQMVLPVGVGVNIVVYNTRQDKNA